MPPVPVPPGSRIETTFIINLLFATPAAVAQGWPVFTVSVGDASKPQSSR